MIGNCTPVYVDTGEFPAVSEMSNQECQIEYVQQVRIPPYSTLINH
jgi:hypothetical protein